MLFPSIKLHILFLSTPNAAKNIENVRKMNQPFQTDRVESLIIIFFGCVGRDFRDNRHVGTRKKTTTLKKKKYSQLSFFTRDAVAQQQTHMHAHTHTHVQNKISSVTEPQSLIQLLLVKNENIVSSAHPLILPIAAFSQDKLYVQMRRQYGHVARK